MADLAQPKRMRSHTFNPSHLYMHEERGVVSCGAHVGIEATYTPTAWLDMGECDGYMVGGSDHVFRCETPHGKVAVA